MARKAGHGALIAVELDPGGSQGTFTTIGELFTDVNWPTVSHPESDVTPHQLNDDVFVISNKRSRDAVTLTVNYDDVDTTHDALTGAYNQFFANELRGFQIIGPDGSSPSTDIWVASGYLQSISRVAPVGEGGYAADFTIRFSGPYLINNVASTAIS